MIIFSVVLLDDGIYGTSQHSSFSDKHYFFQCISLYFRLSSV